MKLFQHRFLMIFFFAIIKRTICFIPLFIVSFQINTERSEDLPFDSFRLGFHSNDTALTFLYHNIWRMNWCKKRDCVMKSFESRISRWQDIYLLETFCKAISKKDVKSYKFPHFISSHFVLELNKLFSKPFVRNKEKKNRKTFNDKSRERKGKKSLRKFIFEPFPLNTFLRDLTGFYEVGISL